MIRCDEHHSYYLEDGQFVQFIKFDKEQVVEPGTTSEELLIVVADHIGQQNVVEPCAENVGAIYHINTAIALLNQRTAIIQHNKSKADNDAITS